MSPDTIQKTAAGPDREASRQLQRDVVRDAIHDNKVLKLSDRKKVALGLARMLEEARSAERGWKTKIASRAWPEKTDAESLKMLDLVTLPLDAEPSERRLNRLAKKPNHYAGLARAVGYVSGRRADDIMVELFRGTQIEAGVAAWRNKFNDGHLGDWEKLTESIEAMAECVAKRMKLREHLRRIAERYGTYSLETESIRYSRSFLLPHGILADGFEIWEEFPPIPSVPLFVKLLADPFVRTLKLIGGVERDVPVTVTVGREVRLAIGPADDRETPRPMFEIRTVVGMVDENGRDWAGRRKWFYVEGREQFTTEDEHGNEVFADVDLGSACGVDGKWIPLVEDNRDATGPRQWEHVYAAWRPVTSISCADLLGGRLSDGCYALHFDLRDHRCVTFLPNDTIGSWIEAALTNGDRVLEKALEADTERLVGLVQDHIVRMREEASAHHLRALAEWADVRQGSVENNG